MLDLLWMVSGAVLVLAAGAVALYHLRWMANYSMSQAEWSLTLQQKAMDQMTNRDSLLAMAKSVDALDVTVGNLARMQLSQQNRTVLTRDSQFGEMPPGAPARMQTMPVRNDGSIVDGFMDPDRALEGNRVIPAPTSAVPT